MENHIFLTASEHAIKSVTMIFKSAKAEIVRHFALNLNKGQNKVTIQGLPSSIDTESVRVSGLGHQTRLFDVVCIIPKPLDTTSSPVEDTRSENIRRLTAKKHALEREKVMKETELGILQGYSGTLHCEHVSTTDISKFLEKFSQYGKTHISQVQQLDEDILALDRQIQEETRLAASKKGSTRGKVSIVISADENIPVMLKLIYIVSNVSWSPTYELHARTENGKPSPSVELHYRARITQSTGEDWNDTSLSISSASPDTVARSIPTLRRYFIRRAGNIFGQVPPKTQHQHQHQNFFHQNSLNQTMSSMQIGAQAFGHSATQAFGNPTVPNTSQPPASGAFGQPFSATPASGGLFGNSSNANQPQAGFSAFSQPANPTGLFGTLQTHQEAPVSSEGDVDQAFEEVSLPETGPGAREQATVVTETPVAITFSVHGKSTIPSDGDDHQVSVAILPFEATVSYVVIPRVEPKVYLLCQVKNTSEYRLLPGPVNVILDDSYVSRTVISDVNAGDNFDCTLGTDTSTKVTYSRTFKTIKEESGAFSEAQKRTVYTSRISIHNKHQFKIPQLVVQDCIPTCEEDAKNQGVRVILRKPMELADARDGEAVSVPETNEAGDKLKVMWGKVVDGKGGEKEGKYEWRWSVASGEKVVLEAEWEVKAPAGFSQWVESPAFSQVW